MDLKAFFGTRVTRIRMDLNGFFDFDLKWIFNGLVLVRAFYHCQILFVLFLVFYQNLGAVQLLCLLLSDNLEADAHVIRTNIHLLSIQQSLNRLLSNQRNILPHFCHNN